MTRPLLGRLIGAGASVAAVLVVLAGSDRPPPPGFVAVLVVAGGLGVLTALLVPRMLVLADRHGRPRALVAALAVGFALGAVVGVGFAVAGPGEPSTPAPGIGEAAAFITVVAVVGMVAAGLVALVAFALDRLRPAGPSRAGG